MEIKIGIASITKTGAKYCGDSHSLVERRGGMTMILSDGHGNTAAAQQTSRWVTQRARSLVLEGKENDAVARAVHGAGIGVGPDALDAALCPCLGAFIEDIPLIAQTEQDAIS